MTTMELIERGIGHNCLSDAYDLGRADAINEIQERLCEEMEKHSTSARPVGWSREIEILTLDNVVDIVFEVAEQLKEQKND